MAKILIIDDEVYISTIIQEILGDRGHEVFCEGDGFAGLKFLEQSPRPDLLMVDLSLPRMSGCEFIEKVNADPKLKGIPVILLTGYNPSVNDFPPGVSYQDIITKPFDLDDLVTRVEKLIDTKKITV